MKIIRRSSLLIPIEYKEEPFYKNIKSFLERKVKEYNKSVFSINTFYIESERFLSIPRYFPIKNYINDFEFEDRSTEGEKIKIKHNISPRSQTQKNAINHILENENAIIQLSPGVGKTVITIYMVATRKRKTFILVHRESLAEQWKSRFLNFTDLSDDKIARLSSSTFEEDLKKPVIISTTQTFISLLNRKREEFLTALHRANIGIFVADEVHTSIGAPTFSECSIHISAKYCYGLSATPDRYDGNGDVIEYHLGSIYADEDTKGTMDADVTIALLNYKIDIPKSKRYLYWEGQFQKARYLNKMIKSEPFIEAVTAFMNKIKDDRNVILIAERIKLIDNLYSSLDSNSKSKFCGTATLETLNKNFTFATSGKCRDGIDAPWKDALIVTSPISNINQLSGRITRSYGGKQTPILIDMVDYGCKPIARSIYGRIKFYEGKGWNIKYILMKDGMVTKLEKEEALKLIK